MSSGQPKATMDNVTPGRWVMRDVFPYKPFRVSAVDQDGRRVCLVDDNTGSYKWFNAGEFNKADYRFAEVKL